jgi:TolA-binding protein
MNKFLFFLFSLCLSCFSFHDLLEASRSQPFSSEEEAEAYLALHYDLGCEYYQRQEWRRASTEFEKVIYFFPTSEVAAVTSYYLAICYFEMKEYDLLIQNFLAI